LTAGSASGRKGVVMTRFDRFFQHALLERDREHLLRKAIPTAVREGGSVLRDGACLLDFSSNDYLGLSRHPLLRERAAACAREYGVGARASRLVTGTTDLHMQVEQKLAAFKGTEAALLFASGWQANASVLPAILKGLQDEAGHPPLVFTDRLNHASLHHGMAASGLRQIRFRHNDFAHLQSLLTARAGVQGARVIVTESVFSMDGDRADLVALKTIAAQHDAFLYVDEAHATGVLGPGGRGLSVEAGGVDLAMGTFSKGFGSMGAYIAGSRALCDYLMNMSSGFVFSTALPPPVLGAIDAALDLIPGMDAERAHLHAMAERVRACVADHGLACGESSTQIVPIMTGSNARTLAASQHLRAQGVLAAAIRPPTVPQGQGRLRLALSASHDEAAISRLCAVIPSLCALPEAS